jgi:hypothetical protein
MVTSIAFVHSQEKRNVNTIAQVGGLRHRYERLAV